MAEAEGKQVATANARFSSDMLVVMSKSKGHPGNFLYSPFSLSAAIGMVKVGTRGASSDEIKKVFHFPDDSSLEKGYCKILTGLQEENTNFTLQTTNRMFVQSKFKIQKPYVKSIKDKFLADVEELDFEKNKDAAVKRINSWVEKKTDRKIKNIILPDMITELTRLVLVNTVYFRGEWREKFSRDSTLKEDFFLNDSKSVKVQMMSLSKSIEFAKFPEMDAKAIALQYKTHNDKQKNNDDLVMIIIAPNTKTGVNKVENNLKKYTPERILGDLKKRKVDVRLPRFDFICTIDCIPILRKLGVSTIFDKDKADLSGISAKKLYVSTIIQKAFIKVDEKGTEATAATAAVSEECTSSYKPAKAIVIRFDADRPFIFQLLDRKQNIILFTGRCSNPEKTS